MNSIEKALQKKNEQSQIQNEPVQTNTVDSSEPTSSIEKALETKNNSATEKHTKTHQEAGKLKKAKIVIDFDKLTKKGFVSTNSDRQLINEEYRAIKRKLLDNAFGPLSKSLNNSNIIMVTSSRPGEGKTFTAINLALSIALEQDLTVLLVDADVLRPNVMRTLELNNQEGLMEFLLGEKDDLAEVMNHTNLDNLKIIPAGKSHHLSTELLASEKMFAAVEEFANRYTDRVVIVDTPPLLGINETAILANLAGQALVVVEEAKTKLMDVQTAVSHLNPDMAIGFVVNKSEKSNSDTAGYGYYYAGASR